MYKSSGEPTLLLLARMQLAKFAATRGWVIPLLTVHIDMAERWREANPESDLGYKHYLELDDAAKKLLDQVKARTNTGDSVIDLGCNVGRDLNELWNAGYRSLTGVEIGLAPVRAMREVFPEMAAGARIVNKSMDEAIREFWDAEFKLVYTHGSLISLNAGKQSVFDHMCRITQRWIITVENEWNPVLFPRDFSKVFTDRGMRQVYSEIIRKLGSRNQTVLRVFEKP